MSSRAERNRNNVVAGTFVLVALALGVGVFLALQKINFRARTPYVLKFSVQDGVAGLARGSQVRVGGYLLGEVTRIETVDPEPDRPVTEILVHFELDSEVPLYSNAIAYRSAPLLGDAAWINFTTTGDPNTPDANGVAPSLLTADSPPLAGKSTPGLLANVIGIENADRATKVIGNVEALSDELRADYRDKVEPLLDEVGTLVRTAHSDYGSWRESITKTLNAAENAAVSLEQSTGEAMKVVANARDMIEEARPEVMETVANVRLASRSAREVAARIETTSLPSLEAVLANADKGVASFTDLVGRLDVAFQEEIPAISSTIQDARTTAQQLKLATIEIRRNPWRLLSSPPEGVQTHEQLYDAARTFAIASGELRVAAEGLGNLSRNPPAVLAADPALQERIRTELSGALSRYAEAQRRLYGVLTGDQGPTPGTEPHDAAGR